MSSQTKTAKDAPSLRFREFRENWQEVKVGDFCTCFSGGTPSSSRRDYYGGEIPFIRSAEINSPRTALFLTEKGFRSSASKLVKAGDLLVALYGANSGEVGISRIDGAINQAILCIRSEQSVDFLGFFLEHSKSRIVATYLQGGQGNLSGQIVQAIRVPLPTLPEQRKIADFLTSVDGRIGQLSQKKALLEDYKKGVMQQLFTQALRFKDDHGNDFPEWEEKKYSEIYTFQNTNSYSRDLLTYEGGEVRNIHYGDIHTKFRSNFYLSKEVVPFIKPEVELKRISNDCYCRVGDLVIADASEDYADVGKCIEIMELGEKTLAGLHTFIARPRKGAISPGFGGYLMQSREVRLKIMTIAQGTKVLGLSKNMLCNIKLPIPHPAEQTKIANFLTALDRKIESVSSQITHTQTFKNGLLQQMFV